MRIPLHLNLRLSSLLLAASLAALPALPAVSGNSGEDLLKKAAAALNDELYDVAEQSIRQYLACSAATNPPQTETVIMLARALHGQKRYPEMLALLNQNLKAARDSASAGRFDFWLAVANYENNQWPQALDQTLAIEKSHPNSPVAADSLRLRAKTLLKLDRPGEAVDILKKIINNQSGKSAAENERLVLGRILIETGRPGEARDLLENMLSYPPQSGMGQQCRVILGQAYLEEKEWAKARSVFEALMKQSNIPPAYRLRAIESLAEIAAAQTNFVEALNLLENGCRNTQDISQKNEFDLRKGRLLLKMNRSDEGIALIHNYVNSQTNSQAGAEVQFELARSLLESGASEKALSEFQNFLETFPSQPESSEACCGKGTALYRLGRYQEAVAAFNKAEETAKGEEEKNQYRCRAAEALFANGQHKAAAEIYAKIADTTSNADFKRLVLLQHAECLIQNGNTADAEAELWTIYDDDPADLLSSRALLRLADLYLQLNRLPDAAIIYRLANAEYGDLLAARAAHGLGMIAYRAGRHEEALKHFAQASKLSGDEEVSAAAAYMSAWSLAMLGKWDEACRSFSLVVNSYGRSSRAPEALFWLGEFAYNSRTFDRAETSFRLLADKYPRASQAADALFWAGRAALNQNEFRRARDYFSTLLRKYPASNLRPESRYFQGIALCELGQFDAAILIFNEMIRQYPEHALAEPAVFKKADCFFLLGSDDPKRYEEAFNAYQSILDRQDSSLAARLQARYKMGRCLEKTGKANEAFFQYMQVVYLYAQNQDQTPACNLWFSRAAFSAAGIMEEKQSWRKAVNIYEHVVEADIPASLDAQERINKLRAEHWLAFY